MDAPSLFDAVEVEPTAGAVRESDPQPSVDGSRRAQASTQRWWIASTLLRLPYVTADWLAENIHSHPAHRSSWSTRLAGLRKEGLLVGGAPVSNGRQKVLTFALTPEGRVWARQLVAERNVA